MNTINIEIDKGEFLKSPIPSNCIFFKNLTGIGATHAELFVAKRNSIIIEPNVPVIIGKTKDRTDFLGIYEDVTKKDIIDYLSDSSLELKKVITTPEGFIRKLVGAFNALEIDFANEYFMLIDECEKLIKDADYREQILEPLEYFFRQKQKAFVSATAMIPSDPRFIKAGFEIHNVIPTYGITKDLNLITTNHSLSSLNKLLKKSKADKVFIFLNSISGSVNLIKSLRIEDKSSVFMSTDGVKKFYLEHSGVSPNHISHDMDNEKLSRYNFLTSRYFSAMDILLEEKTDIIMISDFSEFQYSLLDPYSDTVQIIGRFRKQEYIQTISVIANTEIPIEYVTPDDIKKVFDFGSNLRELFATASMSTDMVGTETYLKQLVNIIGDKAFFNDDFTPNHFMMDNFRHDNHVKSLYKSPQTLVDAFTELYIHGTEIPYFKVNHITENYDLADIDLKLVSSRKPFKEKLESIIKLMEHVQDMKKEKQKNPFSINSDIDRCERVLLNNYPMPYEIFLNEGTEKLRELKTEKRIKDYYFLNYSNDHLENMPLLRDLYNTFKEGSIHTQKYMLDKTVELCKKYNKKVSREIKIIKRFFIISTPKDNEGKRFIKVERYKWDIAKKLTA